MGLWDWFFKYHGGGNTRGYARGYRLQNINKEIDKKDINKTKTEEEKDNKNNKVVK